MWRIVLIFCQIAVFFICENVADSLREKRQSEEQLTETANFHKVILRNFKNVSCDLFPYTIPGNSVTKYVRLLYRSSTQAQFQLVIHPKSSMLSLILVHQMFWYHL